MAIESVAQNGTAVVVVPLGDREGVYSDISGLWSGVITISEFEYLGSINIQEDAKVGEVTATIGYIGEGFQRSSVETRVSESGNVYTFAEQVVLDLDVNTCLPQGTVTLTYDEVADELDFDYDGTDTGRMTRIIVAPTESFPNP